MGDGPVRRSAFRWIVTGAERLSRFVAVGILGWILMVCAISVTLLMARRASLASFDTAAARNDWDAWRAAAKEQSIGKGPVQRRIPKSTEPPALVLMRDYFGVSMTVTLVLSTCLYGTLAWMLHGVTRKSRPK